MLYKVLVVGKKTTIINMRYKALAKAAGIDFDFIVDGKTALEMLSDSNYDMVLSAISTNGINGFELIEAIRAREMDIPIIIASKRNSENDIVHALDIGADDFVVSPINPVILIAKCKALMRRYRNSARVVSHNTIVAGPFSYNNVNLKIYKNGVEIPLSSKENAMMKMFIDNVDKSFSKAMIHETIWGDDSPVDENKVMVYINRIRSKIEDDPSNPKYLVTDRNVGYRFTV